MKRVLAGVFAIGVVVICVHAAAGRRQPARPADAPRSPAVPRVAAPPEHRPRLHGDPPVVDHIPTGRRVVFLTIDDGWHRDPALPGLLRRLRIPVTLFLTDRAIAGHDAYVRALRDAGADIEDHTLTHRPLAGVDAAGQRREICGTATRYARRFGHRPTLLRPPGGAYDATTRAIARSCGIKGIVLWRDSVQRHGRIAHQRGHLRPGDIILMHFRPGLSRDLPIVLAEIRARHLRLARLTDYIG